jgi:dimeric dUTPase (all-alpha-NTP-PPase superfamily)
MRNKLNVERLTEIVRMQDTLNCTTAGGDWKSKHYNWHTYAWVECAEAVESLSYKHWKHQEVDYENVKVELIDILHFVISHYLVDSTVDDIVYWLERGQSKEPSTDVLHYKKSERLIYKFNMLVSKLTNNEDPQFTYDLLFDIWDILGETPESMYKAYMTKNTLNSFRQSHGYKDGTYKKLWIWGAAEVEDNVVAFAIASKLDVNQDFRASLKAGLKHTYAA